MKRIIIFALLLAGLVRAEKKPEAVLVSGVKGGLLVHLGDAPALCVSDRYLVHRPEGDVSQKLPYAENVINLLIVEEGVVVAADEIQRTLAPLGCAMLKSKTVALELEKLGFKNDEADGWLRCRKPWPETIDEWSHWLHGPDGNPVARDTEVGPPRRQRWKAGPRWERAHEFNPSHTAMVSANGRIFYTQDDGLIGITDERFEPRCTLRGRDAFSGVPLWTRDLPNWSYRDWQNRSLRPLPMTLPRRMVAEGDRLYMTMGYRAPVSELDAATGETLRVFEKAGAADELVLADGALYLVVPDLGTVDPGKLKKFKYTAIAAANMLVKIDLKSGNIAWQKKLGDVTPMTLAVKGERLVVNEHNDLVCFDAATGREVWRAREIGQSPYNPPKGAKLSSQLGDFGAVMIGDGAVVVGGTETIALSLENGQELWRTTKPAGRMGGKANDLFIIDGEVWGKGKGVQSVDLLTGELRQSVDPAVVKSLGHHSRCFRAKATSNYILMPNRGAEFLNVAGGESFRNDWLRGACRYGVMPANGLLYAPPHPCMCYPQVKLNGFNAVSGGVPTLPDFGNPAGRRVKGPAYSQVSNFRFQVSETDWPMHRHDPQRLGSSTAELSANLAPAWSASFGDKVKLSQPVVVGGHLFVAEKDLHRIACLDAADGSVRWTFKVGGRIDSAPTVMNRCVYFGSADGWLYCLRAADGKLAWKFRAAPEERFIVSYDQVESAWPVHGSVVVLDGLVYCSAGRSSYLDGGIFVYALDAKTGKLKHCQRIHNIQPSVDLENPTKLNEGFHIEGAKSDILVSDGEDLYMGQVRLDRKLNRVEVPYVDHTGDTTTDMDLQGAPYLSEDPFAKLTHDEFRSKGVLREWHQGDRSFGLHLHTTTTFLDDTLYNRTFWSYSKTWPGYYLNHIAAKAGQMIVVDEDTTYAFHAYPNRQGHNGYLIPGERGFPIIADANDNEPVLDHRTLGRDKGMGFTRAAPPKWYRWIKTRVRAMVRAGDCLALAGTPDVMDEKDFYAAYEGRLGAKLLLLDAKNGEPVSEVELPSPPVFDGMSAARGSLFIALENGSVVRLSKK